MDVHATEDAAALLDACGEFLDSRPVEHNLVLTVLHDRLARPEPGRYWWTSDAGAVTSVLLQSPRSFTATITPCSRAEVAALVDALRAEGTSLPGINGEAATVATFAGYWAERWRAPAEPDDGSRLYRLGALVPPSGVGGALRRVTADDRPMLVEWTTAFFEETDGPRAHEPAGIVDRRLADGRWWIWEDGGRPVSSALASAIVGGASRVGLVYTPLERRGHGYAAACVAEISRIIVEDEGATAILYTQLQNPVSNAVYQRLGYEAVAEVLSYRFG